MKRNGFSLVELIFVIVLMGVLTGVGFYLSRPDYTRQDAQYALLKLKEARYRAIGFEGLKTEHCITLDKDHLSTTESQQHEIKSSIEIEDVTTFLNDNHHSLSNTMICFDSLGRPHESNTTDSNNILTLSSHLSSDVTITFKHSDKNSTIRLYSGTGYAIIPCNN